MKRLLSILVLVLILTGCSAQKRAERHIRKAVALCPELVQMKAQLIDTVLTFGPWVDMAVLELPPVLQGDTIYAATDHGTVVVSLRQPDSALRVGFVAAPQQVHYQDTLHYSQVVIQDPQPGGNGFWSGFAWWFCGLGIGVALCFWVLGNILKHNYFTKKR